MHLSSEHMLADKGLADKQVRGIPRRFPRVLGNLFFDGFGLASV